MNIRNLRTEAFKGFVITILFYAFIGLVAYFSFNVKAFMGLKDWTFETFNSLQGPFLVLVTVLLAGSVFANVIGYYLLALAYEIMNDWTKMKETGPKDTFKYRVFIKTNMYKEICNIVGVIGISVLLMGEIFVQAILSIFIANIVMIFTSNLFIVLGISGITILTTYFPVQRFIKWLYEEGKVPFFGYTKDYEFLREHEEDKLKAWSILLGAIFTVFTVVITMLGIVDSNIPTLLNNDNGLVSYLYLGCAGVFVSALRAAKGFLRII